MTREEQILKAGEETASNPFELEGFIEGAEWADAHPDLYSVTRKAIAKERESLMKKIVTWLNNNFIIHDEYGVMSQFDTVEEMIEDYKKAMEE